MSGVAQGSADGPKKIFGRENVNWQGPQRANSNSGKHASMSPASSDFAHSGNNPEYAQAMRQAFIEEDGIDALREDIVSGAVIQHFIYNDGAYDKERLDALANEYERHFDNFTKSDEGADLIEKELESALDRYDLIDMDKSTDDGIVVNETQKEDFLNDDGLGNIITSLRQYVGREEEKNDSDASANSAEESGISLVGDGFDEEEYQRLRLQDANDRGYDSIEEYEADLEDAEFAYAEDRGVEIARQEAVRAAMEGYDNAASSDPAESATAEQYYRDLFDQYYEEGTNSESVHLAVLTMNSSYEVVDVRDGELEVDKNQEDQWASGNDFNYLKQDFTEYAKKHPFN